MRIVVPNFLLLSLALILGQNAFAASPLHRLRAQNPVIWADVPDVAVIRVDDTYYMSSTTMHMSPGLPLMKSPDLVNWEIVGYAYESLGDEPALSLSNGKSAYGEGSWASSLRYHDGTYYVSTFSGTTDRTYIFRTTDIEKGPWQRSSFSPALHDHSLFFEDDGRVYMVYGSGDIRIRELTADATAIKPGGLHQVIIPNASAVAGDDIMLPAEGSQLRKIDGRYYLLTITWPQDGMRTVLIHRADTLTGPWEGRVALQDKGVAQGCLIDTPEGDWYAFLFQDHGAVGRVPFVVPVEMSEDGWPILGNDGRAPMELDLSPNESLIGRLVDSDDFERSPGEEPLPLVWQWNHNPDNAHWSVADGALHLTNGRIDATFLETRNTLTQRTFGPVSSATTLIDVSGLQDGDVAGLVALQARYGYVGVAIKDGEKNIVMVSAESGTPEVVERIPLASNRVRLRIACDFRAGADRAAFSYCLDGEEWVSIGRPLQMVYTLPRHFMGYRFGLFNFATESIGGTARFESFGISDQHSAETDAPSLHAPFR